LSTELDSRGALNDKFYYVLSLSRTFIGHSPIDLDDRALRRLKLSDLRLLQAVVQCGGMARAAARLNISQPAVSKAIKVLEHTLGVRLLDRGPQGVEPTLYGQALLKGAVVVFDELKQSVKQIEHLADPSAGELRIGSTEPGAASFVPSVIARLSRQHPRVVFRVTIGDAESFVHQALPQRTIDLAIGALPEAAVRNNPLIDTAVLFNDRHFVMAGAQNKWARRRNIALADLADERWVLPPLDSTMGHHIARAFRAQGLDPPRRRVESSSLPLSHHLLATGHFLTLYPFAVMFLSTHLQLRLLDVELPDISRAIGIMKLTNRTPNPLTQLFISHAQKMASAFANTSRYRRRMGSVRVR
jgi:DNA-binding transcriptional LysR family regulator